LDRKNGQPSDGGHGQIDQILMDRGVVVIVLVGRFLDALPLRGT